LQVGCRLLHLRAEHRGLDYVGIDNAQERSLLWNISTTLAIGELRSLA
jgi:hypothetical protein